MDMAVQDKIHAVFDQKIVVVMRPSFDFGIRVSAADVEIPAFPNLVLPGRGSSHLYSFEVVNVS